MSSWAQQRESIRRAVEAGASARTSGQGSELLRLPSGQQLLLSRPNGQPTRAGQFYYQLAGRRAPSRRFNENQQLVRDGPNDYIYLRGGTKKLVRSLQPDGNYRVTKLGKSFFRDKWTDYLAHMPVRIRGRRRNGRPYERETLLPVTLDGLGRQNDSLGEVQAHRNVIAAALREMGDPEDGAVVMEISEETYTYDASRDWAVSKQTMQVVDNRVETEVALNRRLGVLRDVSYQLFRGSEILESAFEQREDRLCVVRQLSELLRLPYEEVYSDFDAICPKNWESKGIAGAEIREFCVWRKAPLYIVNCRGQMLDCYDTSRPSGSSGPWPAASTAITRSSTATPAPCPSATARRGTSPAIAAIGASPPCPSSGIGSSGAERSSPGTSGARTCAWSGQSCWGRGTSRRSRCAAWWSGGTCA